MSVMGGWRLVAVAAMALSLTAARAAEGDGWMTDFEAAKKLAAEKNLPILMDFTGSDWCGWCKRLDAEVFSRKAFKDYAKTDLILFVADFPMRKQLDAAVKEQNDKLKAQFGVRGYPTIVLLDAKGNEIARTGYRQGGAEAYVEHLKGLIAAAPAK